MRAIENLVAVILCILVSSRPCASQSPIPPSKAITAITSLVAVQASTELALSPGAQVIAPEDVRVERQPMVADGVIAYRAWIARDHWHAYQVAVIDGRIVLLGGFQTPDPMPVAKVLSRQRRDASDQYRDVAEKLALLMDSNGVVRYLFPYHTEQRDARSAWQQLAPVSWPGDSILELGQGRRTVRMTLLSQQTHSYAQNWVPALYSLTFDENGRLQAWSRIVGEPILASKMPK